jgi:hypothetical protein
MLAKSGVGRFLLIDIFDNFCTEFATDRSLAAGTANKHARERMAQAWANFEGRMMVIPGKQTISALSEWGQAKYGVSLNATKIASFLQTDEIHPELRAVVEAIENRLSFPTTIIGGGA